MHSARLAPLLCALTSAELASYEEAASPQHAGHRVRRFRSMLIDIFGRSYPEKEFFMVDREAVRRYKARVHRNVAQVGERIDACSATSRWPNLHSAGRASGDPTVFQVLGPSISACAGMSGTERWERYLFSRPPSL